MAESTEEEKSTDKGGKDQHSVSTLEELFKEFSLDSDGETIDLANVQKWFKQANLSQVTEDDVESAFSEQAGSKKDISIDKFEEMIQQLAKEKKLESNELMNKIKSVKPPGGGGKLSGKTDADKEDTSGKGLLSGPQEEDASPTDQDDIKNPLDDIQKAGQDPFAKK